MSDNPPIAAPQPEQPHQPAPALSSDKPLAVEPSAASAAPAGSDAPAEPGTGVDGSDQAGAVAAAHGSTDTDAAGGEAAGSAVAADAAAAGEGAGAGKAADAAVEADADADRDGGAHGAAAGDGGATSAAEGEVTGAAAVEQSAAGADPVGEVPAADAPAPGPAELSPAACAARLAELFPAIFTPGSPKPLKLRIQADIQQRAPGIFTRRSLSNFLHRHTTSNPYLRALASAAQRADLDGADAGAVSDEHRDAARAELDRRKALHAERRAAERQAQRPGPRDPQRAAPRGGPRPPPAEGRRDGAGEGPQSPPAEGQPEAHPDRPRDARPPRDGQRPSPRDRPPGEHRGSRPQTRPQPQPQLQPQPAQPQPQPVTDAAPPAPRESAAEAEARRERAALLRAFETTTLTAANFCALKRIAQPELEAVLARARTERELAPRPAPTRPERTDQRPPQRPDQRAGDRRSDPRGGRGPRSGGRDERDPTGRPAAPGRPPRDNR